ncbi:MAG: nucleotidyltransferase domain-containing protein [Candidatus Omnitrophota bacterium]
MDKLFSSKARVEILKLFLFNPDGKFYQRQIATLTHQPIRAVQREVNKLEEIGLIERFGQDNRVYYNVNKICPIFEELKRILFKSAGIAESLREYLRKSDDITFAFIYGSYAKGKESSLSDIDLLVVGNISSRALSKILVKPKRELSREINYAVFDVEEFKEKVEQKDHFLNTVMKEEKIFIVGSEDEFKRIIKSG